MAQHDYNIANQTGLEFRGDVNNALQAIVTGNSGPTAPVVTFPGMVWRDTSSSPSVLKKRTDADDGWVTILTASGEAITGAASAAAQRTALGLGTASTLDVGISANNVIQLDSSAKLPAVDGSNLFGISSISAATNGAFKNLQASASGTNSNVSISIDEIVVENAANNYQTLRSVSLNINSATVGAGGLDTGSLASNTWYSSWVIWNGTSNAGLLSLSSTTPTLPSGYTHKARIGWIRTDSTVNKYPLSFKQFGRQVRYKVVAGSNVVSMPQMASGTAGNVSTPTWIAVGISSYVPTTASKISLCLACTASTVAIAAPNNSYGAVSSPSNAPPLGSNPGTYATAQGEFIIESTNIYWASNGGACYLYCYGWEDNL